MRQYRWLIISAWLFVLAITVYDVRWAVIYRETANYWESNPIQRWVIVQYGVWVAGAARFSTTLFAAMLMPLAPRRCQVVATLSLVSAHIYLAGTYAVIFWTTQSS
jgi:hypothetical protein